MRRRKSVDRMLDRRRRLETQTSEFFMRPVAECGDFEVPQRMAGMHVAGWELRHCMRHGYLAKYAEALHGP